MKKLFHFILGVSLLFSVAARAYGYEEAFPRTPVNTIEVKTVPAARVIQTRQGDNYFKNSDRLFKSLFRYIDTHKIDMTVPVIGEIQKSGMAFFVLGKDANRNILNSPDVTVAELPSRQVISYGVRGAYTEKNISKARSRLEQYLLDHPDYLPDGDAYAVFWNGPFMIGFLKRFEIHIPIKPKEDANGG